MNTCLLDTPEILVETTGSTPLLRFKGFHLRDDVSVGLLNSRNYPHVSRQIQKVTEKVSECLMSPKAIINSDIPFQSVSDLFPISKFPEFGTNDLDFTDIILKRGPVPNFGSPNFFGQMHPSRNIPAIIANHTATILNQNLIAEEVSPVFTKMENQTIGFLADIVGYDINKAGGSIVSGGTMANRTAMMVARNKLLSDVMDNGIRDSLEEYNKLYGTSYTDVLVLAGEDNHYSVEKIAGECGIGRKKVVGIPYRTGEFSLDLDSLKNTIIEAEKSNKLIVGIFITAGTTEKGHIHDIAGVLDIAKNEGQNGRELYVHVDAAHGGGFLVDDDLKAQHFKSIEVADSVTLDGHKMFYTNYSCGCILFKDKSSQDYLEHSAAYIINQNSTNDNHGRYTLEGSRGTGGLFQLSATIKSFGKNGLKNLVRKSIENTQILRSLLEESDDFEILSGDSPLNLICFRYHPKNITSEFDLNELHSYIKEKMYSDGLYYVGSTEIDHKNCFRAVLVNPDTNIDNLAGFLERIRELAN